MEAYGTCKQPAGTWADDSSMALATLDSLVQCGQVGSGRYLIEWSHEGEYTPFGHVFDAGITCLRAIDNYDCDQNPETCGITGEKTSGNGILMRIMPVVLYAIAMEEQGKTDTAGAIGMIHQVGVSDP